LIVCPDRDGGVPDALAPVAVATLSPTAAIAAAATPNFFLDLISLFLPLLDCWFVYLYVPATAGCAVR
jgi:hypothetical protein